MKERIEEAMNLFALLKNGRFSFEGRPEEIREVVSRKGVYV
jgi:hypothetical protein